ncbi:MAG: hypothetical protein U5K84_06475 [Alkalibacterium sp.]|nr:hypothetical protein [Alkalibacterium sp.]
MPLETKKMQYTKDGIFEAKDDLDTPFLLSPMPGNKLYNADMLREKEVFFSDLKRAQDLNFYLKFLLHAIESLHDLGNDLPLPDQSQQHQPYRLAGHSGNHPEASRGTWKKYYRSTRQI